MKCSSSEVLCSVPAVAISETRITETSEFGGSWDVYLAGGFNPFEKYWSNWDSSPNKSEKKHNWNHQLSPSIFADENGT